MLDHTHDASPRSWVEAANDPAADFPIQNLPLGVFRRRAGTDARIGVAIGDQVLDLPACRSSGLLSELPPQVADACIATTLNALMSLGRDAARALRGVASNLLRVDSRERVATHAGHILVPMRDVDMLLPVTIGDYTDFYASIDHATNVGSMFRPDNPLLPNYKWVPIGYHGRASSVVPSGTAVRRPVGQTREGDAPPTFGPSRRLDYELELGAFVGQGNALGERIDIEDADAHIFGCCILNDWSARDVQTWEYQPLGPFLAKSFETSISPWIVTIDALEPFRAPAYVRPSGDPVPLAYLNSAADQRAGGFDITMEVSLTTEQSRAAHMDSFPVSRGRFTGMYWTLAQLIAHHASNGCNLRPGDLLGSGTVSGATPESRGCLLERTWRGTAPLELATGERRTFLEDGDEVIMRAYCERAGYRRIGFGECRGRIAPASR